MRAVKSSEGTERAMFAFLQKLDLFQVPIPSINLRGNRELGTSIGGLLSLIVYVATFLFAASRFSHLIQKHNPSINEHTERNAYYGKKFNVRQRSFQFAFSLESFFSFETLDDLTMVKWFAYYL